MKKFISLALALVIAATMSICAFAKPTGDVDENGKTDSTDALLALQLAVGLKVPSANKVMADVDNNDVVNSLDSLYILQIVVDTYKGDREVYETHYKETVVDPAIKAKQFTIGMTATEDDTSYPVTIMFDNNNMAAELIVDGIKARMLILDGKTYVVLPSLFCYAEISAEDIGFDFDFSDIVSAGGKYVKSVQVKIDGKTYDKEIFLADDNESVASYYFLNGQLAIIQNSSGEIQKIDSFKAGVDSSWFSLKGLIKIDLDNLNF